MIFIVVFYEWTLFSEKTEEKQGKMVPHWKAIS